MSLHPVWGHEDLRGALVQAVRERALPGCLLLHGPPGGGKQRLALWIGSLLLCEAPTDQGPCGQCKACRQSLAVRHPDLHWFFPLPRPKGGLNPERMAEALEAARAEALAEFRESPLRVADPTETRGIYLSMAQTIRRKALQPPSSGARQVVVVGHAEELVPQESSQEAANALLKLLEEPPPGTTFVLTTSRPGLVLDTIRSRSLPLHVPALPREEVARFLVEVAGADPEGAEKAARLSGGSIGRALGFLGEGEEPGPREETRQEAFRLFRQGLQGGRGGQFALAHRQSPSRARLLLPLLDELEVWLRDGAAAAAGRTDAVINREALPFLEDHLGRFPVDPRAFSRCAAAVQEARMSAAGNVNPQLLVHGLLSALARELQTPEAKP